MFRRLLGWPRGIRGLCSFGTSPADAVMSTAPNNIPVGRLTGLAPRGRNHAAVNTGSWLHHVAD